MSEEQDGIKAIRALQKMAGIEETEEQARAGWRSMNKQERAKTMMAYKVMFGGSVRNGKSKKH